MARAIETFATMLARWIDSEGFEISVKGRIAIGRRLGCSHQTVTNWLSGEHLPPATRLAHLAAKLGVDRDRLGRTVARERESFIVRIGRHHRAIRANHAKG